MSTAVQVLICFFTQLILFFYFDGKYKSKKRSLRTFSVFIVSLLSLCALAVLTEQSVKAYAFEGAVVFISALAFAFLCYEATGKNAMLDALSLTTFKICADILTESSLKILYFYGGALISAEVSVFLLQLSVSEILFAALVAVFLKMQKPENIFIINKISSALLFFPIVSLAIIILLFVSSGKAGASGEVGTAFTLISMLLVCANAALFAVYEKITGVLKQNSDYAIAVRQEVLDLLHYEELERKQESSQKLIHEIKNHLSTVRALAKNDNAPEIADYIDSVFEDSGFDHTREFSRNKLVNIIVSRYAGLCEKSGIVFDVDIRDVPFGILKESSLTSLLENILKNAYEAALNSREKRINLRIELKNEIVLKIYAENSCDENPQFENGILLTTKPDKKSHGYGTKIITKIAEENGGTASFVYDENENLFKCTVVIV